MLAITLQKQETGAPRYEQLAQYVDQPAVVAHLDRGRHDASGLGRHDAQADSR
ncbi:hypothetical protein D3C86_1829450 [compost metagenome]